MAQVVKLYTVEDKPSLYKDGRFELERPVGYKLNVVSHLLSLSTLKTRHRLVPLSLERPDTLIKDMSECKDETSILYMIIYMEKEFKQCLKHIQCNFNPILTFCGIKC